MSLLSPSRLKFLSLALLMSGGTVVLTQQWLQGAVRQAAAEASAKATPAAPASGARVLVAKSALAAGTILKSDDVRWQPWPANASTEGYFTESNSRIDEVAGGVVRANVDVGEPLTAGRVVKAGDRSFLAAVLQPGYRAVTVNVNAASGVAGFVLPGDRVDLLLSRPLEATGEARRFVSETVLRDVRVLGVDQRAFDAKKDVQVPQTATLEVSPKGAEVVAVASELGKLSLSLRSLGTADRAVSETRVVTRTSDQEAIQAAMVRARPAARPEPRAGGVQVFRGSEVVTAGAPAKTGAAS